MVTRAVHLPDLDDAFRAGMAIIARETLDANLTRLEAGAPFGMDIRLRLEGARAISDAVLAAAEDIRGTFTQSVDDCLSEFDVIVTPALPQAPPLLSEAFRSCEGPAADPLSASVQSVRATRPSSCRP